MCKKKTGETSVCVHCETEFVVKSSTSGKYCSPQCWYDWKRAKREKQCPICEADFYRTSNQETCSSECGRELKKKRTAERNTRFCETCTEPFVAKPASKSKYCSRSCAMHGRVSNGQVVCHPDGTRFKSKEGYIRIKINGEWMQEHRHVIEQRIGRKLEPHERVHHKNGKRNDNHPDNLELWTSDHGGKKDPSGARIVDVVINMIQDLTDEEKSMVLAELQSINTSATTRVGNASQHW